MVMDLAAFVERNTSVLALPSGMRVRLRPLIPEDRDELGRAIERASPETRYRRFMAPVARLTTAQLRYLTEIDYVDHFAWLAIAADEPGEPGIGVSRYVRLPGEPDAAEAAVAVLDAYQRKGIGALLLEALAARAAANGVKRFRGTALAENGPILRLLASLGAEISRPSGGEVSFQIELPGPDEEITQTHLYRALRAAALADEPPFPHPVSR